MRRPARVLAAIVVVGAMGVAGISGAGAAPEPPATAADPATTCRGDGPAAVALLPTVEPLVQQYLGDHRDDGWRMPGLAIAIVAPDPAGGALIIRFSCGVTAEGGSDPVTTATRWEIGSETKLFTAAVFARFLLDGTLARDDRLVDLLPTGPVPDSDFCADDGNAITLLDLATHNSGLTDYPHNKTWGDLDPTGRQHYTQTKLFDSLATYPPDLCAGLVFRPPGTGYRYSDWGFALLGTVLANVYAPTPETDPPAYGPMIADLVTGPLGMTATELEPLVTPADLATPTCQAGMVSPCPFDNVNAFAGAGGLISSIGDMATFVKANLGYDRDTVLWPALALTREPAGLGPNPASPMGLGWLNKPADALTALPRLEKDGGTNGMHSQTYIVPEACWGITFLSNSDTPAPVADAGLAGKLLKVLSPKQPSPACADPAALPLDPAFTG